MAGFSFAENGHATADKGFGDMGLPAGRCIDIKEKENGGDSWNERRR